MANTLEQQKSELQKFMEESQRKQKEELAKWLEAEKAKMESATKTKEADVKPKTTTNFDVKPKTTTTFDVESKMTSSSDVKSLLYEAESRDTSSSFNFRSATNKETSSVLDDTKSLLQKTPVIIYFVQFQIIWTFPHLVIRTAKLLTYFLLAS